ncbi:MAG: acetyl-CoA C-acyltransferase [Rickettsiales bacterium]|nr:acetyl-CoA C-acyltransferase [Rickettsiales bacterium]|tara:strand:+ start:5189 stop:6382 length:1194 start_codon:yes stop_codon:yes gene_type:complete
MKVDTEQVVFLSGVRTPFGSFGGSLKNHTATDLAVVASKAAIERAGVNPEDIDQTIIGNAQQTSADAIYLARHVGLRAGVPNSAPALTINRLCGSGFQSIVSGAEQILLGQADFVLAGGTENMSQAPFVARNVRWGVPFGREDKLSDSLWDGLYDPVADLKMAETAEKLGAQYNISREECDEFAYRSHAAYAAGLKAGNFDDEIVPVMIKKRREEIPFSTDEHPRLDIDKEAMVRLRPVFKKDGLVTAGNASGICDGGAAVVIARGATAAARGLKPIARLVAWGVAGCDPTTMGIGPAPASRIALSDSGLSVEDMDLVEVNEAFAPQYLAVEKELGLNRDRTNVNGGAISIGHPLACSGTRITLHLIHELRRRGGRYGLGTACIGGGQGISVIVEAL